MKQIILVTFAILTCFSITTLAAAPITRDADVDKLILELSGAPTTEKKLSLPADNIEKKPQSKTIISTTTPTTDNEQQAESADEPSAEPEQEPQIEDVGKLIESE